MGGYEKLFILDTVQGITGSESIGETSLIIYYGILVGTLEVRLEI